MMSTNDKDYELQYQSPSIRMLSDYFAFLQHGLPGSPGSLCGI